MATIWRTTMSTEYERFVPLACPYCESEIGQQVYAGIFNSDFALNAALTLIPIPILSLIVALIHFGKPWRTSKSPRSTRDESQPGLKE